MPLPLITLCEILLFILKLFVIKYIYLSILFFNRVCFNSEGTKSKVTMFPAELKQYVLKTSLFSYL